MAPRSEPAGPPRGPVSRPRNTASRPPELRRAVPEVVAPTNRVNVALPLSKITVQEPSEELAELAAVVAALADSLAELAPGERTTKLRKSARALAARLR